MYKLLLQHKDQFKLKGLYENMDEMILIAYEKKIPILQSKDGKLVPIPEGAPQIPLYKAKNDLRHAIQNLLTKGETLEKTNP
ncbi:MAG: hypothetical protein ACK5TR_05020 [Alphaproteobacteria bacterium]|jgi:hypothetical protein